MKKELDVLLMAKEAGLLQRSRKERSAELHTLNYGVCKKELNQE